MTIEEMNRIRRETGVTYQRICQDSGVPISTVAKVLGGATKNPRMETVKALERTLRDYQKMYAPGSSAAGNVQYTYAGDKKADDGLQYTYAAGKGSCSMVKESFWQYGNAAAKDRRVFTTADRDALPDDRRTELIDGILYDMAAPSLIHQLLVKQLARQIDDCIAAHETDCELFFSPADVIIDRDIYTAVQPDIFIICDRKQLTEKNVQGAPAFVLEVVSPSSRRLDFSVKQAKYFASGVKEYWIVDSDKRRITVLNFMAMRGETEDGNETEVYSFDDTIPVIISEGRCRIDMKKISAHLSRVFPESAQ